MGKFINSFKRKLAAIAGVAVLTAPGVFLAGSALAASPWNLNGYYNIAFTCTTGCSGTFTHDATISGQTNSGDFNVAGGFPAGGPHTFAWSGTGNVSGNAVTMSVDYDSSAPNTHMNMTGTVASNGSLSGTWSDNYPNGTGIRGGSWTSTAGVANNTSNVIVVTPANQQGWSTADTRPGGAVTFVNDNTSPAPNGALQLTTDATTTSKAQYLHSANTPLPQVNSLSYSTKQVAGPAVADPSYQLIVCLTGAPTSTTCPGFTTFVFEPYQNGTIVPGAWQTWDVASGQFWSTKSVTCSNGATVAGAGGAPFYTLSQIETMCPSAVASGFGVNIGSNNPGYNVETDLFNFNGTVYDFQITNVPTDADQCKNGGFVNFTDNNGNAFKNQGQCVSFVNSNRNHTKIQNNNSVKVTNNNTQNANSGNANVSNNTTGGNATSGGASNSNSNTNSVTISNNPTF